MRARVASIALLLLAGACTGDQASSDPGLTEPIRIESAQFVPGALPGSPAPDGGARDGGVTPDVVDVSIANTAIAQGELGLVLAGHTSTDAQTIGVRFADLGTGYWVTPVGAPDPSDNGLLTWQLAADFGRDLPPGFHDLVFAAVGSSGASGTQAAISVCLDTPVPDNLNICVPKRKPPAAVVSLSWDNAVDLDLIVETPSGATIGGKSGSASASDGGTTTSTSGGVLDRDSNRACVIDDIDREDIVWQAAPAAGNYQVWADLFSACGKPSVHFTVSLWLAETQADGTQRLVEQEPPLANGLLVANQANGGASPGLFVGNFELN